MALQVHRSMLIAASFAASGAQDVDLQHIEIAPGVIMPTVNLGGIHGSPGNHTLWIELGGRGLDTAEMYGDDIQAEVAAAVVASSVSREELFVTSKIPCCPSDINPYFCEDGVKGDPLADIERTYRVLDVDYIDLLLLHMPCNDPDDTVAAYRAMEDLVAQGRARSIGISNFNESAIDTLLTAGVDIKPAVNQCAFSVGNHNSSPQGSDMATFKRCQEEGIVFSAYSPLGGLSHVDVLHDPVVEEIASAHNVSTAQVSLRWLLQQHIPLVTATDKENHMQSNLDVFGFVLSEDEMQRLFAVGDNEFFADALV